MIRLQAFGGAVLVGADGLAASRTASQRRTIGLLSLLAVAGEAGLSRDKLIGILWPDASIRRARHSLTQALYAARKALDCDDLFVVSEDVRLNPERITSDVLEFQKALERGDDVTAAELYRGPLLDGFYLASPEFERWHSAARDRLENHAVAALERLTSEAEDRGDLRAATMWLGRISSIRPSDEAVTIRLMQLLAASGDRARAIEHAEIHARLLRDEYEIEPDPQVIALARTLRTPQLTSEPGDGRGSTYEGQPTPVTSETAVLPAGVGSRQFALDVEGEEFELRLLGLAPPDHQELTRGVPGRVNELRYDGPAAERALPSRLARGPWFRPGVLAVLLLLIIVGIVSQSRREPMPVLDQRIVVAPFRVHDADASLSYLREGLVDLLSTRLADDENARGVDAGAVLRAWRRAGITRESSTSRDTMMKLAASFGAERLIIGSVVGGSDRAVLSASVVHVPTGQMSDEAVVEGPIDSLLALADQLAGKLLLTQAGPDGRLAEQTTQSLPALRSYLSGLEAYARGDHAVAAEHYASALRTDSTFALAALRMALAADRLNDFELQRRALATAWRYREGMSERDRVHLRALLGPQYPAPSTRSESMIAWEEAASVAANSAEVWYGFARATIESGAATDSESDLERARAALQRTLDLDPHHGAARMLLAHLQIGDAAIGVFLPDSMAADSLQPLAPFLRWRQAAWQENASVSAAIRDSLAYFGPANLRAIAAASQFDGVRLEDGARAVEILLQRASSYEQAFDILLAQHALALNRGSAQEALQASARLQRLSPATRAHLRLRVLDAVYGNGDQLAARSAAEELVGGLRRISPPASAASDACALAQWQLATGNAPGALVSLESIVETPARPAPVSTPTQVCAKLIEAGHAVATGATQAAELVSALDSLVFTTVASGDAAAWAHIAIARMHRQLNEPVSALRAIRRRPYMSGVWPRYLATAMREENELIAVTDSLGAQR